MFKQLASFVGVLAFSGWTTAVDAGVIYSFSFGNVLGTVAGPVQGTIRLDFLSSLSDSGTGAASQIQITSAPGLDAFVEGNIVTAWQTQALNTFTVSNGDIIDYQFGASEGSTPALTDSVMCLNNGGQFNIGGVYHCNANENWLGKVVPLLAVYNEDGIQAVTFDDGSVVPVPATLALFSIGLASLGWSRRKKV